MISHDFPLESSNFLIFSHLLGSLSLGHAVPNSSSPIVVHHGSSQLPRFLNERETGPPAPRVRGCAMLCPAVPSFIASQAITRQQPHQTSRRPVGPVFETVKYGEIESNSWVSKFYCSTGSASMASMLHCMTCMCPCLEAGYGWILHVRPSSGLQPCHLGKALGS